MRRRITQRTPEHLAEQYRMKMKIGELKAALVNTKTESVQKETTLRGLVAELLAGCKMFIVAIRSDETKLLMDNLELLTSTIKRAEMFLNRE